MSAPFRPSARRPVPGVPRDYHFPRFERRRLDNDLQIIVAPVHKLPIVTVSAIFDAGAATDPAGREGLAQLTTKLLLEGTRERGGAELIERFEGLGASVDTHADYDSAIVTATALTEHLHETFALLSEVLRVPAFAEREVDRLKAERLAELLQLRTEPRGLADELSLRFVYEASSRYARPDGGDEASVSAITRGDIEEFFAARFRPAGATIIVVGDISADDAEAVIREHLGNWSGSAPTGVTAIDRPARNERAIHIISKPDAPQSELRIGHVGIPRKHPDYFAVVVMNAVLGGLFNSRINLNLREVHGYTYGASSSFGWRRQAGPFVVSTAVKSDVTDSATREILAEIDRIRTTPIGAEELSLATSYLDGVFPIRFETTTAIAAALALLVVQDLPDDYYDRYRARVRATTIDQVLDSARRHLKPEMLQVVVVGDPEAIAQPLLGLGVGDVSVYDAQCRPRQL
jgi:zinc protease